MTSMMLTIKGNFLHVKNGFAEKKQMEKSLTKFSESGTSYLH